MGSGRLRSAGRCASSDVPQINESDPRVESCCGCTVAVPQVMEFPLCVWCCTVAVPLIVEGDLWWVCCCAAEIKEGQPLCEFCCTAAVPQIKEGDPRDVRFCCRLIDSFEHSGPHGRHVCMVFEVCAWVWGYVCGWSLRCAHVCVGVDGL